jgi:hypothetical protein
MFGENKNRFSLTRERSKRAGAKYGFLQSIRGMLI